MKLNTIESFYTKYKNRIPPFYRGSNGKFLDIIPLISYYKLYDSMGTDSSLKRIGTVWFADSETGYVMKIENKYAFKKCRYFYTSIFKNKRRGKRYIFGLLPNGKTVLCAILTHISSAFDKHSSVTKSFLNRARIFIISKSKEQNIKNNSANNKPRIMQATNNANTDNSDIEESNNINSNNAINKNTKDNEYILNQWRIDKYVFALTGTGKHANDNVTNWPRVYKMAFMSRQFLR